MSVRGRILLEYFEKRFPFFDYTFPLLIVLYPFIPYIAPLYMLPKYYGLHGLYLFMMIFNLRLFSDIKELHLGSDFKLLYKIQTVFLLGFCLLFSALERGEFVDVFHFNWRSYFFALTVLTILSFNWAWQWGLLNITKNQRISELVLQLNYPLILVPPVMSNLHASQSYHYMLIFMSIFSHAALFKTLKNRSRSFWLNSSFGFYVVFGILSLSEATRNFYVIGAFILVTGLMFIKRKNLDYRTVFIPTLILGWGLLFF